MLQLLLSVPREGWPRCRPIYAHTHQLAIPVRLKKYQHLIDSTSDQLKINVSFDEQLLVLLIVLPRLDASGT